MEKEGCPASLRNHNKEITRSSQVRDHCSELSGMTNVDVASKIMEDIELRVGWGGTVFQYTQL